MVTARNIRTAKKGVLVDDLQESFEKYIRDLRNKNNKPLRDNFETRYDFEAKHFSKVNLGMNLIREIKNKTVS